MFVPESAADLAVFRLNEEIVSPIATVVPGKVVFLAKEGEAAVTGQKTAIASRCSMVWEQVRGYGEMIAETEGGLRRGNAVVGTGSSLGLDPKAVTESGVDTAEVVPLCDSSRVRVAGLARQPPPSHADLSSYQDAELCQMLSEVKPETMIVVALDRLDVGCVVDAFDYYCGVISVKAGSKSAPLEKFESVATAKKQSGREVPVVFTARHDAGCSAMRRVRLDVRISIVYPVGMSEILDTSHGDDSYRPPHRHKIYSGALLIYKQRHRYHFVSWWLDDQLRCLFGSGLLTFYGKRNAERRGEVHSDDRYVFESDPESDPFALILDLDRRYEHSLRRLELEAQEEACDGRDANLFALGIGIEDAASVIVDSIKCGTQSYSLVTVSSWAEMRIASTGDHDRKGSQLDRRVARKKLRGAEAVAAEARKRGYSGLGDWTSFGGGGTGELGRVKGGYAGENQARFCDLSGVGRMTGPLGRVVELWDGIAALLLCVGVNRSLVCGIAVNCARFVDLANVR